MAGSNLLPPSYRDRAAARRARRLWIGIDACCALAVAAGVSVSFLRSAPVQADGYAEQLAQTEARQAASRREAGLLSAQLAADRLESAAIDAVAGQPDWRGLLLRISATLGDRVMLDQCRFGTGAELQLQREVAAEGGDTASAWLVLGGVAQAYEDVPALVLRLEELGLFDRVVLIETTPRAFSGEERIGFRIACRAQ